MRKLKYLIITLLISFCLLPISIFAAGSISVSTTNLNITKGGSSSFRITLNNAAGRINISSSNSSVASVSSSSMFLDMQSGTVTVNANNVGNATIRVYAADVTTYDDEDLTGRSYTINVNVTEPSNNNNNNGNNSDTNNNNVGNGNNGGNNVNKNNNKNNKKEPVKNLSTNNSIKELSVDGYDLVKIDNNNYTLTVSNNVTNINVKAILEDEKSNITGTGFHEINVGENNIEIVVTSESGAQNKINIKVTRKDGYYLEDLDDVLNDTKIKDINIIISSDAKLTSDDLNKIKKSKKIVKLNYYDDNKKLIYSFIIDGSKIKSVNDVLTTISYTSKYVNEISKLSNYADGLNISLSHNGKLPTGTKIKLYVGDKYADSSKLNLYYYNTSTKKLELVQKEIIVTDGYIEFNTEKGSEYFLTMSNIILSNAKEGNGFNVLYITTVAVFVIIAGILIFLLIKKNKKEEKNESDKDISHDSENIETIGNDFDTNVIKENEVNQDTEVKEEIDKIMTEYEEKIENIEADEKID